MTWIVFDEPDYIFGSGIRPGVIQRAFITLDSAQQGHYALQNPITYNGFFKLSFLIETSNSGSQKLTDNNIDSQRMDLNLNTSGELDARDYGHWSVDGVATTTMPRDGKFHLVKFERDVTDTDQSAKTIGVLGSRFNGTSTFDGIIANPDLGNGNAWPLDVLTGNTQQAANGNNELTYVNIPEGAPDRELFTLNTSTDPDQWENADKSRIIQVA